MGVNCMLEDAQVIVYLGPVCTYWYVFALFTV